MERRKLQGRVWSLTTEKEATADAVEMAERRSARRISSFSVTCSRLSKYLREKGSFGELGLNLSGIAGERAAAAKPETPRTMNLMPGVEFSREVEEPEIIAPSDKKSDEISSQEQKKGQMTIFFGGKIVVFDDFPAEKAKELMIMAKRSCPAPNPVQSVETPPPVPQPSTSDPPAAPPQQSSQKPSGSDLPIARRVSLNRFLEKRKDRITSKAPYPAAAAANGKPEEGEKWPGQLRLNG